MNKPNPTESLNASIAMLEQKRKDDFKLLKEQLRETGESMKPGNLIRSALKDVTQSSQFKSILIKTIIGLAAGFVAKKLVTQHTNNRKNKMLGNALQLGMTFLASNRNTLLKNAGIFVANSLITTLKNRRQRKLERNGVDHAEAE